MQTDTSKGVVPRTVAGAGASAPAPRGSDIHKLVAGQILAAMVSRASLASTRCTVRDGDMTDAIMAAKLAAMVCDACERG